uniref:Uncharacterized protein n=1 Tax=Ciona savignyi TaxID=51511 RepID=H2YJD2_CIOSA
MDGCMISIAADMNPRGRDYTLHQWIVSKHESANSTNIGSCIKSFLNCSDSDRSQSTIFLNEDLITVNDDTARFQPPGVLP